MTYKLACALQRLKSDVFSSKKETKFRVANLVYILLTNIAKIETNKENAKEWK